MWNTRSTTTVLAAVFATTSLLLAACGSSVNDAASTSQAVSSASAADPGSASASASTLAPKVCGKWGIAMNAWVGYTASAQVVTNVAKSLGCTITQTKLDESATTYDAMEAGSVDVVIEDWGGGRWKEWVDRGAVKELGANGNVGLIGMFVPQWMCDKYPDIADSANLNKYAEMFKTVESGGKGAWYEGPPGYTTIGEKMVSANKLNYKVINTGSEAALIDLLTKAGKNQMPALAYWYTPQYFNAKVKLCRVNFPKSDWTDAAKASGLTDYPETTLVKLATTKLVESGDPFANLVANFRWTNADQDSVSADIEGGMTPEAAAQKWIDAHADKVKAWTGQ
jgi:glycine betaine/proline transport system substrate-binding protein